MLRLWDPGQERTWLGSMRSRWQFRPRYNEIDSYGHVGNGVYDTYFEAGRLEYFKAIGDPEQGGLPFPFGHVVAELHIRFMARCYFDEALEVRTKIAELGRSSAGFEQAIVGSDEGLRAVAATTIVRHDGKSSTPWTEAQRRRIAGHEGFVSASAPEF